MHTFSLLAVLAPGITAQNLRCEYRVEPRGIDAGQPRLSWNLFGEQGWGASDKEAEIRCAPGRLTR
jgi:hypothetical protein